MSEMQQDRMQKRLKASIKFVCAVVCAAVSRLVRRHPPRVVLYYHGVSGALVEGFRRQMAYLAKECLAVKPCDIGTASAKGSKAIVAVTFDDAFVSVMENALPILREYGLPAAIFVPTGNLGRRPGWTMASDCQDKDDIVMDEQQIAALSQEGFEMLSHTISHRVLTELDESDLEAELVGSKQDLERIIGCEVPAVSYPHGACDDRVYKAARKAGYRWGFSAYPIVLDGVADPLGIGRFAVSPRDGLATFKLKAHGAYQAARPLMKLKRLLVHS